MCTEIPLEHTDALNACQLVPLIKDTVDVRPIDIGEILRRIMEKSVSKLLVKYIQMAGGCHQKTCTGLEGGIKTAVHAIAKIYGETDCEPVPLVDAKNAFNLLSRKTALHNIKKLYPPLYHYL